MILAGLAILLAVALVLWARGLIKASRTDLIVGCCVFVAVAELGNVWSCGRGIAPLLGMAIVAFSIVTLVAGARAGKACPLDRGSRRALCVGMLLLGVLLLLVV